MSCCLIESLLFVQLTKTANDDVNIELSQLEVIQYSTHSYIISCIITHIVTTSVDITVYAHVYM